MGFIFFGKLFTEYQPIISLLLQSMMNVKDKDLGRLIFCLRFANSVEQYNRI
jgi:hypothetical protein